MRVSLHVSLGEIQWALVQALLVLRGGGLGVSMMPAMTAAYAAVRPGDLGDATALANIAMRVGGALGAALCVIALSRSLNAAGPPAGFTSAFLALTVICVLATLAAAWLRRNELQQHQTPTAIPSF
jgi:predicted MFS family arabinose efflux permease